MDHLIDNLARELAKPTSRRGVMRLIGGAMLGGLVAAWKPASLQAQHCNPPCPSNKPQCCTTGSKPFCARADEICCGKNKTCKSTEICCGNSNCCHNKKQTCVHGRCQASKG